MTSYLSEITRPIAVRKNPVKSAEEITQEKPVPYSLNTDTVQHPQATKLKGLLQKLNKITTAKE